MMSAYFPDFSQIGSGVVCEWIFALANQMSNEKKSTADNSTSEASIKYVFFVSIKAIQI